MKHSMRRALGLVVLCGAMALSLGVGRIALAETLKTDVKLTTEAIDAKENVLGNVIADAMRDAAKADVAFIAASSFKEVTLPKGSVSTADVLKALEYKDESVVIVKLTGEQIQRAFEHGLYLYPKPNSAFLQFSGLVVTINPDADKERRVVSIKIGGDLLEGGKTYKVAMPETLANGALAYFKIWKKDAIEKNTNKMLETAVTSYLSERKTIAKGDERLVIKGK